MEKKFDIKIGKIYGDLKCIDSHLERLKNGSTVTKYTMKCTKCGREKDMIANIIANKKGITHKACGKGLKTKDKDFYNRWQCMRNRTNGESYHSKNTYKDRGINSDEFENFIDFYDAMYDSFKELADKIGVKNVSLERKDVNKSYTKENCIWIHKNDQPKNTTKTVNFIVEFPDGKKKKFRNINEFSRNYNISSSVIHDALNGRLKDVPCLKGMKFTRI